MKNVQGRPAEYPGFIEPAMPTLKQEVPAGDRWVHEVKLDGYRTQAHIQNGSSLLFSRRGYNWTDKYSPIAEEISELSANSAILDGEMVAVESGNITYDGFVSDFRRGRTGRLIYYAFDLLYLNGYDLRRLPLIERKARLEGLLESSARSRVLYCSHFDIPGQGLLAVCEQNMEGVVSKVRESTYSSGRTGKWVKVKCIKRERLPIIGFIPAPGSIAALYVGRWQAGKLEYAGKIGTGFTARSGRDIRKTLDTAITDQGPVEGLKKPRATWVKPIFEADVQYSEISGMVCYAMPHSRNRRASLVRPS